MLQRERSREIASQAYIARLLQAGFGISDKIFNLWSEMYAMEVYQHNYDLRTIRANKAALMKFDRKLQKEKSDRQRFVDQLTKLSSEPGKQRPPTQAEREEFKQKLRRARLERKK